MGTEGLVIITGATRGLGLSIAQRLLEANYDIVGLSRKPSRDFEELLARYPQRARFRQMDLGRHESLHAVSASIVEEFGPPFGLVNNAAIAHDGILATMHDSHICEVIDINVTGTIILTKYLSRAMLRGRTGRIVNVSSIIGSTGFNGLSVYGASKAALIGFTKSLSRELGRVGITVNAIAPGYMQTDMSANLESEQLQQITRRSALRRLADVREVAAAVVFLMSKDALGITGTTITIDAGSTA